MIATKCTRCGYINCNGNNMICSPKTQELVKDYKESIKTGIWEEKYYKTVHQANVEINLYSVEQQVREQSEYFKRRLLRLEKYEDNYVKLEDVLALFSAKKE